MGGVAENGVWGLDSLWLGVGAWGFSALPGSCGAFPKLGVLLSGVPVWHPQNKDHCILVSILGWPISGNYHAMFMLNENHPHIRCPTPH